MVANRRAGAPARSVSARVEVSGDGDDRAIGTKEAGMVCDNIFIHDRFELLDASPRVATERMIAQDKRANRLSARKPGSSRSPCSSAAIRPLIQGSALRGKRGRANRSAVNSIANGRFSVRVRNEIPVANTSKTPPTSSIASASSSPLRSSVPSSRSRPVKLRQPRFPLAQDPGVEIGFDRHDARSRPSVGQESQTIGENNLARTIRD